MPAAAPYQATARVRSRPSGKLAVSKESDDGATMAAPMPWSARAAMRNPPVGAQATSRDASEKTASPATNTRRRPTMSPSRAPSSRRPPNTSVLASWTHDIPTGERSIASPIVGRPVKMIELSSRIMK